MGPLRFHYQNQGPELGGAVSNLSKTVQHDQPRMGSQEVKSSSAVRAKLRPGEIPWSWFAFQRGLMW